MLRSRDVSRATSITSASAATLGVCSCWSMPRSGTGTSGFAVEATERVSRGRGSWRCWNATLCRFLGFACASGARSHESHQRKSRMVEISLSGSGEGLGGVILRGYSTGRWRPHVNTMNSSSLNRTGIVGEPFVDSGHRSLLIPNAPGWSARSPPLRVPSRPWHLSGDLSPRRRRAITPAPAGVPQTRRVP